jgi:uncharacterized repeat protein (TIGR01451 family)
MTWTSIFTIDTVSPVVPTIVTPMIWAQLNWTSLYVTGTWEAWGSVTVKVWNVTKVATIDGLGNWNVWAYSVTPWYEYAIVAKQSDMWWNQSVWTTPRNVYVLKWNQAFNLGDYMADLFLIKKWVSEDANGWFLSWSSTVTEPNKNIRYTLEYNNLGTSYATWVVIEEKIPENTCFTIGSMSGMSSDSIVEYSNDWWSTYVYVPTWSVWMQDCWVTNVRVRKWDVLGAKENVVKDWFIWIKNNIGNIWEWLSFITITSTSISLSSSSSRLILTWDFNGDWVIDYFTSLSSNEYNTSQLQVVYWWNNILSNPLGTNLPLGVWYVRAVEVININNDQYDDIAINYFWWSILYLWRASWFDEVWLPTSGNGIAIGKGDFDNNGINDLIFWWANGGNYIIKWSSSLNSWNISLYAEDIWGWIVKRYVIWDYNSDGYADAVIINWSSSSIVYWSVSWLQNISSLSTINSNHEDDWSSIDINNDGYTDAIIAWSSSYIVFWWPWNSPSSIYSLPIWNFYDIATADFNNDWYGDAVMSNNTASYIMLWSATTGTISYISFTGVSMNLWDVWSVRTKLTQLWDYNNDGYTDAVLPTQNNWYSLVVLWWSLITNANILPLWYSSTNNQIAWGDINNDNIDDVIIANNDWLSIFYGGSTFPTNSYSSPMSFWSLSFIWVPAIADYNNDWTNDIVFPWNNEILISFTNYTTWNYTTTLASTWNFTTWNKLLVQEETQAWVNKLEYSIYGVIGTWLCNTWSLLVWPVESTNSEVDISSITWVNSSICVKVDFSILTWSTSPVLKGMMWTWNNEDVNRITFDVRVKGGNFSGTTVTNTASIRSSNVESNTWNNAWVHVFSGLPSPIVNNGWWFGWGIWWWGGWSVVIVPVDKTPTPIIKPPVKDTPVTPVKDIPKDEPKATESITPTIGSNPVKEAIVQTSSVWVWTTVEIKTPVNPVLESEKKCYSPKEIVNITLGKNTTNKDQMVYQALLKSYDLTMFSDTDLYRPDSRLRRNEAAKMFVNFAKYVLCREKVKEYNDGIYTDIIWTDETLVPYIKQAYEYGILKWSKWVFRPTEEISRKEFVAGIMRMFTNENLDVQNVGNEWDQEYVKLFKRYELDKIVWEKAEIWRYEMSKIMYTLYYNPTYEWTDKGYVLPTGGTSY